MKIRYLMLLCLIGLPLLANDNLELAANLRAYRQHQKILYNPPGYLAAGEMLRAIKECPSDQAFAQWFDQQFIHGRRDIYFRYPEMDSKTLNELCAFANYKKRITPTQMDIKYSAYTRWKKTLSPYYVNKELVYELDAIFFEQGSQGDYKIIQKKIRNHLDQKEYDQSTLDAISKMADLEGYEALKGRLNSLRAWQNSLHVNPHNQLYALSERMAQEMETILLFGGSEDDFECWTLTTFSRQSPYFQYPGTELLELEELFTAAGLSKPLEPTPMDCLKEKVIKTLASTRPLDIPIFQDLLKQIESLESRGSIDQLRAWYFSIEESIEANYPGISAGAVASLRQLLLICQ